MSKIAKRQTFESDWEFIVLDSGRRLFGQFGSGRGHLVSKSNEIENAILRSSISSVWIMTQHRWADCLLKAAASRTLRRREKHKRFGDLVLLAPPRREALPSLHNYFGTVVGEVPSFRMLPSDQLAEVLGSKERGDLFIGGIVDEVSQTLTLTRGDLRSVVVPLSIFRASGESKPDFQRFALDDYGYALRFGDYEASADSVLFEADPDYRKRINAKRKAEEQTFGASLRRLRILRRLSQDDFPGIAKKTIGRIERGEITTPHKETLGRISSVLGVEPDAILSY